MYPGLATTVIEQRLRDAEYARLRATARKLRRTQAKPARPSRRVPHLCTPTINTPTP
ncbi:MAG: hypothetical protein QOE51_2975 [Actinoplanes sp.]|jgi:hypothetical protein|nr:hypothetical protein [Actinoplanes sp.]